MSLTTRRCVSGTRPSLKLTLDGIVLDRSAFYPGGGGQPQDHGVLLWGGVQTRIVDARKGDDVYLIPPAEGDPLPPVGAAVRGGVEDGRRTALMRTHSGLHVLCGVVLRDYGALVTGGNMEAADRPDGLQPGRRCPPASRRPWRTRATPSCAPTGRSWSASFPGGGVPDP